MGKFGITSSHMITESQAMLSLVRTKMGHCSGVVRVPRSTPRAHRRPSNQPRIGAGSEDVELVIVNTDRSSLSPDKKDQGRALSRMVYATN